jgi:hypothetical protein
MQTNHLSHFLLTKDLLPLLNKAAASKGEARIINHQLRETPYTSVRKPTTQEMKPDIDQWPGKSR